ncbi:PKD domain-containing protein [Pedobacter changchengzhani]|uniref:PKD domain-containing protein n=1 Tax=Pedobacter changchengzhani TaxID=2529274 RepID=A0A4R5MNM7_9SPHI|nr:PKD domain-containing protein [Pedobacter changchengzhani]TDG37374.1 PKD domain-containing protein [Pedobacter changchengzhani]
MKRCRKIARIAFFIFLSHFFCLAAFAQVNIGAVDPGPYTAGSTIAIPFSAGSTPCVAPANEFQLFLSDESGNFATETQIGTYNGFYSTFINGIIPTTGLIPGTGYRVRIKSTDPVSISTVSNSFEIKAGTPVIAKLTSTLIGTDPDIFGSCAGQANKTFYLKNESTAGSTINTTIKDELNGDVITTTFPTQIATVVAKLTHYTIFTRLEMPDGSIATKANFLINNDAITAFTTVGNNIVCLPTGELQFKVNTSDLEKNFPGNTYIINWGDGTFDEYTICDIKSKGEIVSHTYKKSSCGNVSTSGSNTTYNAFDVSIKVQNTFCGFIGSPIYAFAKVVLKPQNKFTGPITACTNAAVTFKNNSTKGENPNSSGPGCTANNVTYNWFVDGNIVEFDVALDFDFVYTFTTKGIHTVRLESNNSGACNADPFEKEICIQDPPKPKFALSNTTICTSNTIKVTDLSIIDNTCNVPSVYSWVVTPAVSYANGTNSSSPQPEFIFSTPGLYSIVLNISSASCGVVSTIAQNVVVNETPTITLSPDVALCNLATYDFNNLTLGPTRTVIAGTYLDLPSTYIWTVTGGAFSFANGTDASTKYPSIEFKDYTTYTVSVTQTNGCGAETKSQKISFSTAPQVDAGIDQSICFNDGSFALTGVITGPTSSSVWIGGFGVFTPNRNSLNATYTPTTTEKNTGSLILTLRATTTLPAPCNQIDDEITLTIKPDISITSAPSKNICTGTNVNYQPTNNVIGSTYTWTASGSASGFTPVGSGQINDLLTNANPLVDATVTYVITPHNDGCNGTPFNFIVTVKPRPDIAYTAPTDAICNKTSSAITLSSNLAGTTYTYTSVVTAGTLSGNSASAIASPIVAINDILTNTGTTEATVKYTVTPNAGNGCGGTAVDIEVKVLPGASIAFAGADDEVCNVTNYTLNGNNPIVGIGKWTVVSAPNTINFVDTQFDTAITGLIPGNSYELKWTIADGCSSSSDNVIIKVNKPSAGGTTTGAATVCAGNSNGTITLNAQVGNILRWESSPDGTNWTNIGNAGETSINYTNLNATTHYRAVIKNGVCAEANSTETIITVNQGAVVAKVGADQVICNSTTTTLTGNNPLTNIGLWELLPADPSVIITNPGLYNTTVTGLVPGQTYSFRWTISGLAPCPSTSAILKVQIDLPSKGGTTTGAATVCAGNSNGTITLNAQVGNILRWESSPDGTNWTNIGNAGETSINYTNLNATTHYRADTKNGVCAEANSTETVITVNQGAVVAKVGADQVICNSTTTTLTGNNPLTNIGLWELLQADPSVIITNPGLYNTTVTGLVPGQTYSFRWTISGLAPCPSTSAILKVQIDLPSIGGTTTGAATFCAGNSNGTITLNAQVGNILRWESSPDGTNWTNIGNAGETSITYTNLNATTHYRAATKNGVCAEANSTETVITVNQGAIVAKVGADQVICNSTTTTLTGNNPLTNIGLWELLPADPSVIITSPGLYNTTVTGLVPGQTYSFRWTISGLAPCPSTSAILKVQIDLPSNGGTTTGAATVCAGNSNGTITLNAQIGNILRWESSPDGTNWTNISNAGETSITYTNLNATTHFRAVTKNGVCAEANSTETVITVNQGAIVAKVGADQVICNSTTTTLTGNNPLTNIGLWELLPADPSVIITNPGLYNTTVTGLVPGQTYSFRWTISGLAPCPSTSAILKVQIDLPSNGGTTTGDAIFCSTTNTGSILLGGQTGQIVKWQSSIDGTNWVDINSTANPYIYSNVTTTTQFRAAVSNGICGEVLSTETKITINPITVAATVNADQNICSGNSAILTGNDPSPNTGLWTLVSGQSGVIITNSTSNVATATGLIPGENYIFRWTISGFASCPPTFAETAVNYYPTVVNTISGSATPVCSGQNMTIIGDAPTGGTGIYTYQWQSSADGTNFTDISGETSKDLGLTVLTTQYYQRIVNSNVCTSISNIVKITALPSLANNTITATQAVCVGDIPAPLIGSLPTGGDGSYTYQWQSSFDGATWVDLNLENNIDLTLPTPTSTILYRRIVGSAACTGAFENVSNVIKVTLNPHAKAEFTSTTNKACSPFILTPSNIIAIPYPDRNNTYTWYADNIPIGTGEIFPGYTITNENHTVAIKLVVTSSLNCRSDEYTQTFSTFSTIIASFSQSAINICSTERITFTNTSTSLTAGTFLWDFGNGTTSNLTSPPPVIYLGTNNGRDTTYVVKLTSITTCGTSTSTSNVTVIGKATSIFSPDKTLACVGSTIIFSNFSPGNSNVYKYDFDDGSPILTVTDNQPVSHTYDTFVKLDYTVKLTVKNSCGTSTSTHIIRIYPNNITPSFFVDGNNTEGCAPLTVNFTNNTQGASKFIYDFGDGGSYSSNGGAVEIVPHTFTTPGDYEVKMFASNGCFSAPVQIIPIKIYAQPTVSFTADKLSGCNGTVVKFKNNSINGISFIWDFGDGTTSDQFEPTHTYSSSAVAYTVTLTAKNTMGCPKTSIMADYINIVLPPKAIFTVSPNNEISIPDYTFKFNKENAEFGESWTWDFGDGSISKEQNPTHTYANVGKFNVTLRVTNATGCETVTMQEVRITGVEGFLNVPNSFMPSSAKSELRTFMAKGRGLENWRMTVFNKWGQIMWETTQLSESAPMDGWDGTYKGQEQPQGVYYWKIEVKFINGGEWKGMTYDSSAPKRTGVIYLIR